jgi:hypothetical protein
MGPEGEREACDVVLIRRDGSTEVHSCYLSFCLTSEPACQRLFRAKNMRGHDPASQRSRSATLSQPKGDVPLPMAWCPAVCNQTTVGHRRHGESGLLWARPPSLRPARTAAPPHPDRRARAVNRQRWRCRVPCDRSRTRGNLTLARMADCRGQPSAPRQAVFGSGQPLVLGGGRAPRRRATSVA